MVKPLLYKWLNRTLKITDSDTAIAKEVKSEIKRDLQERYHTVAIERVMNVAAFLDLHYKELPFLDEISRRKIIDQVEDELLALEVAEAEEEPTECD